MKIYRATFYGKVALLASLKPKCYDKLAHPISLSRIFGPIIKSSSGLK
jgi:hypothetical protein